MRLGIVIFVVLSVLGHTAIANEELTEGTVIGAANLDEVMDKTFEGHRIGDLLIERVVWQIREHGLSVRLAPSKAHVVDPQWRAATEKYSAEVKYDPVNNTVSGWKAGLPFPELDETEPEFVKKLIWNIYLGQPHGDGYEWPRFVYVLIDAKRGIERVQHYSFQRIYMKGRVRDPNGPVMEPGNILHRSISWGAAPQDIKDTGVFTVAYDDGSYDDAWAYIRDLRRTRRLSSSSWRDPIGTTDQLTDDFNLWNAHPSWYESFEFLGKKTILVIANAEDLAWLEKERDNAAAFPLIDQSAKPYWNPLAGWEPREVWVVKCTPKKDHPYGHKVIYVDTQLPVSYLGSIYDQNGEFWKFTIMALRTWPGADDPQATAVYPHWGAFFDFKRMHGTYFFPNLESRYNISITEDDVSLMSFEARAR